MENIESFYLSNIPQEYEKHGIAKVLLVRHEVIHLKHILTEMFVRKRIDYEKELSKINWTVIQYIEYWTNILRKVHYFNRNYTNNLDDIVKNRRDSFFKTIELYKGLDNVIALDFDGVVTTKLFNSKLYELCVNREKTIICSANPTIKPEYFTTKQLSCPYKILSNKGKIKKLNSLIQLNQLYDNVFYVDDELEYLNFAWMFGLKTYHFNGKTIKKYSPLKIYK